LEKNLIYGPVPSRRLGYSLGVDLVPYKVCSYNCVYCQIGPTQNTTIVRGEYASPERIISELTNRLSEGVRPDYITLGGSGEPTLNTNIGDIIRKIKKVSRVPVAVLTNGSLLYDPAIQKDISQADVVLPSFDACNQRIFSKINRPHPDLNFNIITNGLIEFSRMFAGQLWLEVFIVDGINAEDIIIKDYIKWINEINPDKIHLNTAVRPAAEMSVRPLSLEVMQKFCQILGKKAEVVASFKKAQHDRAKLNEKIEILNMLSRRPCTIDDISAGLGIPKDQVIAQLEPLIEEEIVEALIIRDKNFYQKKGNVIPE
jgi:wyosine [tRNA(Phe)-imidazoG37] synthetase (radical SAM superfamily)